MLGEHNVYIVQDLLGRSDADLARLALDEVLT